MLETTAKRAGCWIAIAAGMIAALVVPGAAVGADGAELCHDSARDLVTRRAADACDGRVVDKTEAERIRDRRRARIRRSLGGMTQKQVAAQAISARGVGAGRSTAPPSVGPHWLAVR